MGQAVRHSSWGLGEDQAQAVAAAAAAEPQVPLTFAATACTSCATCSSITTADIFNGGGLDSAWAVRDGGWRWGKDDGGRRGSKSQLPANAAVPHLGSGLLHHLEVAG
jgi:hypothetical protein